MSEREFPEERKDLAALRDDNNGAIMIIGLAMSIFCIGIIYYLWGVGETVVYRERMQDAADAGTFAASAVAARGMNMIAILNIIMAICMAILLGIKVIEAIAIAGIAIASIVSVFCMGCASPAVAFLTNVQQATNRIYKAVEPVMQAINSGCHYAQLGIKYAWPGVAQVRAVHAMTSDSTGYTESQFGVVWPIYPLEALGYQENGLPVTEDKLWVLCERGGEYLSYAVSEPFADIPVIGGALRGFIRESAKLIARAFYPYFCGAPDDPSFLAGDIPGIERRTTFPTDDVRDACSSGCETANGEAVELCGACVGDPTNPGCAEDLKATCDQAQLNEDQSSPFLCRKDADGEPILNADGNKCEEIIETDHGCQQATDAGACGQRSRQAAQECFGSGFERGMDSADGDDPLFDYRTEDRYRVYYRVSDEDGGGCDYYESDNHDVTERSAAGRVKIIATPEALRNGSYHRERERRPDQEFVGFGERQFTSCSTSDDRVGPSSYCAYENFEDVDLVACAGLPLYQDSIDSFRSGTLPAGSQTRRVVNEVYKCSYESEEALPLNTDGDTSGDWERPMTVHPDLYLGDNDFQYRSIAFGEEPPGLGEVGVKYATLFSSESDDGPGVVVSGLRKFGQLSVAQSEFYWVNTASRWEDTDHAQDQNGAEYLWYMGWQARMRRTTILPIFEGDGGSEAEAQFEGMVSSVDSSGGFFETIIGLMLVH